MVHVVAYITAVAGKRSELLAAFADNVPLVLAEDGCIEYGAAVDADGLGSAQAPVGPDTFVVLEKWASVDALKAHARAPHMAAYAAKAKPLTAARTLHVFAPVDAGSTA
jgi:quinol monooxygenase YgiN